MELQSIRFNLSSFCCIFLCWLNEWMNRKCSSFYVVVESCTCKQRQNKRFINRLFFISPISFTRSLCRLCTRFISYPFCIKCISRSTFIYLDLIVFDCIYTPGEKYCKKYRSRHAIRSLCVTFFDFFFFFLLLHMSRIISKDYTDPNQHQLCIHKIFILCAIHNTAHSNDVQK